MNDTLRDLLNSGFMIYPANGKFVVKKDPMPHSPFSVAEQEFDTYLKAVEEVERILRQPPLIEWTVLVRYNRGLGIEYKHLETVFAETQEIAKEVAQGHANSFEKTLNAKVAEVRVRPKF